MRQAASNQAQRRIVAVAAKGTGADNDYRTLTK
jgi:hypothetical protein